VYFVSLDNVLRALDRKSGSVRLAEIVADAAVHRAPPDRMDAPGDGQRG
jgi:hypothetical protein